ncbi:MAG: hypothetical protein IJ693_09755 [Bacteroidaceae bacterium]|nr:hypothetical protein [Bacteroidaceae bacterium]
MEKQKVSDVEKIKKMKTWTALVGWELIIVDAALSVLEWWMPFDHTLWNSHGETWSVVFVMLLGIMVLHVSYMCSRYLKRKEGEGGGLS